jgi:hypothetical protein
VALLGIGTAAGAAPADVADRSHGFYFNKPGATMAQGDADAEECGKRIAGTVPRGGAYAGPGLMGALVGGIGNGIATGLART